MTEQERQRRWYHPTPARFFVGLLVIQVFLFLSEQFQWFWFNEKKGWTVLIAVGVVCGAVVVTLVWGLACFYLRRRFQFGVRSLLLGVVVLSLPLGWFTWEMQKARRQREAVEAILALGGEAEYDHEPRPTLLALAELAPPSEPLPRPTTPEWLWKLLGVDFSCEVVTVSCEGPDFGDDDAKYLRELTKLEQLILDDTQITDNGLEHLKGMTNLRHLLLAGAQITDDGLEHLKGLIHLENLTLFDAQITDVGLGHLRRLTNLNFLGLSGTEITDDGLNHLRELPDLQGLFLIDTQVTDEGVKKLEQALPNCEIVHLR